MIMAVAIRLALALLLSLSIVAPVAAQDLGLDPLLFADRADLEAATEVQAEVIQLYRLPFSFHLRKLDMHPWGLKVTFPVSLTSLQIDGISSLGSFVRKLRVAAIIPGLEMEIPVGARTLVRPFVEVGIGRGSGRSAAEVMYGAGVRARTVLQPGRWHLTYGGSIAGRKTPALAATYDEHAGFEGGIDAQLPLGFTIRNNAARGGVYVIGRAFDGLELERVGQPPLVLRGQFELGASFSTAPDLRIWKIRLPWLAAGYQFGDALSAVRFYLQFPL
jgi:hypothetical protein